MRPGPNAGSRLAWTVPQTGEVPRLRLSVLPGLDCGAFPSFSPSLKPRLELGTHRTPMVGWRIRPLVRCAAAACCRILSAVRSDVAAVASWLFCVAGVALAMVSRFRYAIAITGCDRDEPKMTERGPKDSEDGLIYP